MGVVLRRVGGHIGPRARFWSLVAWCLVLAVPGWAAEPSEAGEVWVLPMKIEGKSRFSRLLLRNEGARTLMCSGAPRISETKNSVM
ncbi:hypothetical protein [Acanthopleuribacter pedis]|uniref:Uncharacterized protein n=1 Tax=Acanthopleuribacter pedis TaxID=442870 RepID=A0A8J7QR39_9BACT|nr:hypothetical protein [Acanthopleuribacter pedis]MBO1323255.1 hypothetical protein [Acanthopleuribacter pedis]